jgi:hypothetical protein
MNFFLNVLVYYYILQLKRIVDAIYHKLLGKMIEYENHKYDDMYLSSFTSKLFLFKFVNTNLSVIVTIWRVNDIYTLYSLLVGMIISKSLTFFFFKIIYRYMITTYRRKLYFRKVKSLAEA